MRLLRLFPVTQALGLVIQLAAAALVAGLVLLVVP
jgi:hypothetical protein